MFVYRNNEARSCNHCFRGKATTITLSECVSANWSMRGIKLSSVACLYLPLFSPALSHKQHDIREKVTEPKTYILIASATFA
jgi:hypothetical protein